jgi:RimJ/RimL family protein N-acetyltransferase
VPDRAPRQNRHVALRPTAPPDPPLDDGVVALRPWAQTDAAVIVDACSDPETVRWLDSIPQPYTLVHARAYVAGARQGWRGRGPHAPLAVVDAGSGDVLGSCGVHWVDVDQAVAEVGYWVRPEVRGRGVATRATRLVAEWVLGALRFERLELRADPLNGASCRVAERAGFTREGVLRSVRWSERQGRRIDLVLFSLLRSEL